MTVKSSKFPLPLSSLEDKSPSQTHHSELRIKTPQTATQNARQHGVRTTQKRAEVQSALITTNSQKPIGELVNVFPKLPTEMERIRTRFVLHQFQPDSISSSNQVALEGPRRAMVERLVEQGIKDEAVLAAMSVIPRHQFVDSGLVGQSYIDASLPIGSHQTISQPYIVARMIEIMRHGKKLNHVLEIGTGCGYQAAVLSKIANHVYSIERIKVLHELARKNLRSLRIANLRLHYGDGMHGLPQLVPFDGIILAAAGMHIPDDLLQQLAIGGRLIAPIGKKQQVLQLIERTGNTHWTRTELEECHFVPLCSGVI